jgi:hypothetical protein
MNGRSMNGCSLPANFIVCSDQFPLGIPDLRVAGGTCDGVVCSQAGTDHGSLIAAIVTQIHGHDDSQAPAFRQESAQREPF